MDSLLSPFFSFLFFFFVVLDLGIINKWGGAKGGDEVGCGMD